MPFFMTTTPEPIDPADRVPLDCHGRIDDCTEEPRSGHRQGLHQGDPAGQRSPPRYSPRTLHVLPDHILIPGLINLHTHAAMSLMRGMADDLPLMEWLHKHIWPTESANLSPQFVHDGTRLACAEMLRGGITCFNDMYFFPDAAARAASALGMRAMLGITTLEFPTPFASDADDYIAKGLAVRERWHDDPLIGSASPRTHPTPCPTAASIAS